MSRQVEFIDWTLKQPNDRPLSMNEILSSDKCGCLMVQFAKEVLQIEEPFQATGCSILIFGKRGYTSLLDNSIF